MTAEFARTLPATCAAVPGLLDAIQAWLEEAGVPMAEGARTMIALDEILSNIAMHGGGTMDISLTLADRTIHAAIADDGPAFDPLARPEPDTAASLEDRDIGGLGIHLVREMMDDVSYAHSGGQNRLTFRKTF
ncbi:ATP-binding protein [Rhizorhabdus argentea]|uniref:ATP-binding protein n=1 Tax=Rhizorhabdus argentea TaxID=1387174 RepID=UPI0030EDCE05